MPLCFDCRNIAPLGPKLDSGECSLVGLSSALIENQDKPTRAFDLSKLQDLVLSLNPSLMLKSVKDDASSLRLNALASLSG